MAMNDITLKSRDWTWLGIECVSSEILSVIINYNSGGWLTDMQFVDGW